ncbi:MAG: hypothetical protein ABL967_07600 [Bryobacteraceae bacterium]
MAFLARDSKGTAYLSWTDPLPQGGHALRYAQWMGTEWSAAREIARGEHWFVNWADFPAFAATDDGALLAHWLTKSEGSGTYGYGIHVARKASGSDRWAEIFGANLTDKVDYAGFMSFVVTGNTAGAVYLSPAAAAPPSGPHDHESHQGSGESHRKTLRYVAFTAQGTVASDREIDADTCTCCQTTVISTPKGLVAAYRDHEPGEIRDISVVRLVRGSWTQPVPLHRDGWKINGCPVEGPSAASSGENVGIAWYTKASGNARVQMTLSSNSGERFADPLRIDDGEPYGHPSVSLFDSRHYLVAWYEKATDGRADLRMRRVSMDGVKLPSVTITTVPAARAAGLPKVLVNGNQILLAWRDERVRTAVVAKSQFLSMEKPN